MQQKNMLNSMVLDSCEFYCGDMKDVLQKVFESNHPKPNVLVTKSAKKTECTKVVEQILKFAPPKLSIVGYNSATQARDLALMKEQC